MYILNNTHDTEYTIVDHFVQTQIKIHIKIIFRIIMVQNLFSVRKNQSQNNGTFRMGIYGSYPAPLQNNTNDTSTSPEICTKVSVLRGYLL